MKYKNYVLIALAFYSGMMLASQMVEIEEDFNVVNCDLQRFVQPKIDYNKWANIATNAYSPEFLRIQSGSQANECGVYSAQVYHPSHAREGNKPLAILLIHGTGSKPDKPEFISQAHDSNPESILNVMDNLKSVAKELAEKEQARAYIISWGWSGYESDAARRQGGLALAGFINTNYSDCNIITVAHSHGGNVVNYASHFVDKPIHLAVHIGTPVIQQGKNGDPSQMFLPMNMRTLLNFYSTGDAIQWVGGANPHRSLLGLTKRAFQFVGTKIRSLPLMRDSSSTQIEDEIYSERDDYDYGLIHMFSPLRKIDFTAEKQKKSNIDRIINVRTQVNGFDPDHSMLKQYVTASLFTIQSTINANYKVSNDLDMNLDFRKSTEKDKRVLIAIRKEGKTQEAEDEKNYSQAQNALFKALFKKDIGDKGSLFKRISTHTYNTAVMAKPFRDLMGKIFTIDIGQ